MSRALFWLTMALLLAISAVVGPGAVSSQSTTASVVRSQNVPGFSDVKYPDVLGDGDTVYIGGSTGTSEDRTSRYVTSKFPFETLSDPQGEGDANGQSDYSPTVLARGPDGWIYKVWLRSERGNRGIFMYRKPPNSNAWEGPITIISPGNTFRVRVDVAVTTTGNGGAGRIFVAWDENSRYRFKYSDNRGESWSSTLLVSEDATSSRPMLAADPGGGMWIAYSTAGDGDAAGRVKAGVFEGDHFNTGDILAKGRNNYFSDPTISVRPNDGVVITAWRDVNGGIYYGELQANAQWATSRLVSGATAYGTVAIVSDPQGNAHLMWGGDTSGNFDYWYAYKPYNQGWQGPILGTDDGDLDANVSVSSTVNGGFSYAHAVGERFSSNGLRSRYVLGRGLSVSCTGTVVIDSGATATNNAALSVAITPTGCTPAEMQVSLNTPPSANTPRQPYASNITVNVPAEAANLCIQTVYVELYKNAGDQFSSAAINSDAIVYDGVGDVDAFVQARNPNITGPGITYTPFGRDAPGSVGASNGDPQWTRTLQAHLSVNNAGDCTGLTKFVVGGTSTDIANGSFAGVIGLPYPASTPPGAKPFDVTVFDLLGNSKVFPQMMFFDPIDDPSNNVADQSGRPVVRSATLSNDNANAAARKSILRTLAFTDVNVLDNLYRKQTPGTQFWGVWVANGPRNVNPQDVDPNTLTWTPIHVPNPGSTFSIQWNIFNNGPGPVLDKDGTYPVFVRFLDGAGNPSSEIRSTTFTLDPGYKLPTLWLPTVVKP